MEKFERFCDAANMVFLIIGTVETLVTLFIMLKKGFSAKVLSALSMSMLLSFSSGLEVLKAKN